MTFLSLVSDNERRVAVTSMASARVNIPDTADALKNLRDDMMKKRAAAVAKKKQAEKSAGGVAQPPEHIYESSPERSPQKKRPKKNPPADKGKRVESSTRK